MRKLIDEDGKIFGLVNPVDLGILIILIILGVRIVSYYRPAPLVFKKKPVMVGIIIRDIPPYLANSILVGQDLFQVGSSAYIGKISTVVVAPAELLIKTNGRIVLAHSPANVDLHLIVKSHARIITGPARSGIYLGKLAVRVGDRIDAHTLFSSINGEFEFLRINDHGR